MLVLARLLRLRFSFMGEVCIGLFYLIYVAVCVFFVEFAGILLVCLFVAEFLAELLNCGVFFGSSDFSVVFCLSWFCLFSFWFVLCIVVELSF